MEESCVYAERRPTTSESSRVRDTVAISSTAASKTSSFARDGCRYPLILRTNCSAAAWISSSVAGSSGRLKVLMLLHMDDRLAAAEIPWSQGDTHCRLVSTGCRGAVLGLSAGTPGELIPMNPGRRIGAPRQAERYTFVLEGPPHAINTLGAPRSLSSGNGAVRSQHTMGVGKVVAQRRGARHRTSCAHCARYGG